MRASMYKNRASVEGLRMYRAKKFRINETYFGEAKIIRDTELDEKIAKMIVGVVASKWVTSFEEMQQDTNVSEICIPRQVCMTLIREKTAFGVQEIGDMFNKSHATVSHAKNIAIPRRLKTKPRFRNDFSEVEQIVKEKKMCLIDEFRKLSLVG